jgi:hypothetical protein
LGQKATSACSELPLHLRKRTRRCYGVSGESMTFSAPVINERSARVLSSTGIARLQQSYDPVRLPPEPRCAPSSAACAWRAHGNHENYDSCPSANCAPYPHPYPWKSSAKIVTRDHDLGPPFLLQSGSPIMGIARAEKPRIETLPAKRTHTAKTQRRPRSIGGFFGSAYS